MLNERNLKEQAIPKKSSLTNWSGVLSELFFIEKRSVTSSTPDSSSGVISDDQQQWSHTMNTNTTSDYSESFSSPCRNISNLEKSDNNTIPHFIQKSHHSKINNLKNSSIQTSRHIKFPNNLSLGRYNQQNRVSRLIMTPSPLDPEVLITNSPFNNLINQDKNVNIENYLQTSNIQNINCNVLNSDHTRNNQSYEDAYLYSKNQKIEMCQSNATNTFLNLKNVVSGNQLKPKQNRKRNLALFENHQFSPLSTNKNLLIDEESNNSIANKPPRCPNSMNKYQSKILSNNQSLSTSYSNKPSTIEKIRKRIQLSTNKTENISKKAENHISILPFNFTDQLSQQINKEDNYSNIIQTNFSHVNNFDDNYITKIFTFLDSDELCRCAMVCKRWYNLVWNPFLWYQIVIRDKLRINADRAINCLTTALSVDKNKICVVIEEVDLTGCVKLTDEGLYILAKRCPELRKLVLDGCIEINNIALFEVISRCTNLEILNVAGCRFITTISLTPEANLLAATYGKQVYLRHLDLTDCPNVDDSSLQTLVTYCSLLSHLYLRRCVKVGDIGLQYAACYCSQICELSVSDCPKITDLALRDVARLGSTLRYLSLAKCKLVTDSGIRILASRCDKLRYLNLRGLDAVTDDSIVCISMYCFRLKSLDLGKCDVSNKSLISLAKNCSGLRRVSLRGCRRIGEDGIVSLARGCRQLQQLNLIDCRLPLKVYQKIREFCGEYCTIEHNNPGFS